MINNIIAYSIKNKFAVGLFVVAIIVGGLWSMARVPIDTQPDITNNQVQVITQAPNLGTEDIEQFVTYPVELAMANLPGVVEIRSVSRFGLSVVTIVFEEDMGTYLPRQLVSEKLVQVREEIPEGFGELGMGPIATGLGEIYQYTLKVDAAYQDKYSPTELRTMQDWIVRRQMAMVPGVVEVNSFGGYVKQYEVAVSVDELRAIGLSISDVFQALKLNNQNTGGAYIEKDHMANFIRGEGLARNIRDIEHIVVKTESGIPIRIKDIAKVQYSAAVRYGAFTKDGQGEAVGGIIMMLKDANSNEVIENVKARVAQIQESLPDGVSVEPFLDRKELIERTTSTIKTNLFEGALIVIFVLVLLLGNWRGGIIVASTIPLSLFFAFIMMYVFDVGANLMSLGAIDFGIIIDGAVIVVEGTIFYIHQRMLKSKINAKERDEITHKASSKMMNAAFFGQLIILIVFLPILFLEGIEGKMFKPMALTFMFAMMGAMILCLTYVPAVSSLFIRVPNPERKSWGDRIVIWVENIYEKTLVRALKRASIVIVSSLILFALAIFAFVRMGAEFMPQLDEGDIAFHIILKPGSSLSEGIKASTQIEKILLDNFPEVEHVLSRFGVADVPTDPMPMDMGDCFVILKPQDEWVSADSKEELIERIKEKISVVPGISYEFSQPIEMRFNELISGVREDIAVKLYGDDLEVLAAKAEEMGRVIATVEGVADMKVEATTGMPQMTIHYERDKLAQYGLNVSDINSVIEIAFAGGKAGVIFEGERRFDLVVRLDSAHRKHINDLKNLYLSTPSGTQIPLKEVARISYEPGPMQISRDNTNRRTYVGINVRGRDIKSLVQEIQEKLRAEIELPAGYYIRYGGAFENLERANSILQIVVPVALILIFILIYFALNSFKQTVMIYIAIPLAAIGGVYSLWLRDMPFSISAGIGFIVLFGVAVLNGLVLISGWNELKENGVTDLEKRIKQGARRRLRPIFLTALTDVFGFLPMAMSTSAGAEVQQPLATVVIGGMITSTLLTLIILPILYRWAETRRFRQRPPKSVVLASVLIGISIFTAMPSKAQQKDSLPEISMEEAVDRAIANYPKLKAARLQVSHEQALKKIAWDLGSTEIYTGGEELGGDREEVYTIIGVQQQDIDVFGISARLKAQAQKVALAEASLNLDELELRQQVKKTYVAAYVAKVNLGLYKRLDSVYQDFQRAAQIRYEVEETSRLAYLAASNQVKQIALQMKQAEYDYGIALTRMNLWLVSDTFYTVTPVMQEVSANLSLSMDSIAGHPVLQVVEQKMQVTKAEQKIATSELFPKLNALYGAQEIAGQSGYYQFQIGISIPLFFLPQQGRLQAAKIQHQASEQEYLQTQFELRADYHALVQEYRKWLDSWQFYENEALPLVRDQRSGAVLAYKEGAIDYVSFIQNLKETVEVEFAAQEALNQYLKAKIQLEYYLYPIKK